jgi:hypothetical protein
MPDSYYCQCFPSSLHLTLKRNQSKTFEPGSAGRGQYASLRGESMLGRILVYFTVLAFVLLSHWKQKKQILIREPDP